LDADLRIGRRLETGRRTESYIYNDKYVFRQIGLFVACKAV